MDKKLFFGVFLLILFFVLNFLSLKTQESNCYIVSGVVPHHLVAEDIIERFFCYIRNYINPDTIIILSPDHFHLCNMLSDNFLTVKSPIFKGLKVNKNLITLLSKTNLISESDGLVSLEHGIMNILFFIKKYFPTVSIIPIIVPQNTNYERIIRLTESLDSLSSRNTFLIASVDFSHYLPKSMAYFHDIKSIRTLINFDKNDFDKIEVDSWQSLFSARYFAKLRKSEYSEVIAYKNSNDYVKENNLYSTTSYFSVVFKKGKPKAFLEDVRTLLFVGDIMLGRNVWKLIEKNSPLYPFEKIRIALRGIDTVVGNLEGAISKNSLKFLNKPFKFCFNYEVVKGLSHSYFNLLSLANNHTLDGGIEVLNETKEILEENGINFVGDPISRDLKYSYENDDIIVLAFNLINVFDKDSIMKAVEKVREQNPYKFLIIMLHWGFEYDNVSSLFQRNLAHKLIEKGADLIIGTHPHVVQEIELYKGSLIFYSLGNFVFDQYFSEKTQQGLMVGLELSKDKKVFRLFPIKSNSSQPTLMKPQEAKLFLENLSEKSSNCLKDSIKNGVIEILRKDLF